MIRRSRCGSRSGFTLIELLVVIAIIGTLVAMLLPAVQMAREAARRNTCSVNQKNLGLAVQLYVGTRKFLPGYRDTLVTNNPVNPIVPVSWATMLLPQLDQRNIFDQIKLATIDPATQMPYLEIMACPSDPQDISRASTSYAANCGMIDVNTGYDPTLGPPDYAANGAFVSRWDVNLAASGNSQAQSKYQRVAMESFADGTSNTILLTENLDAGVWNDTLSRNGSNGFVSGTGATPEISNGIVWIPVPTFSDATFSPPSTLFINGPTTDDGNAVNMYQCRPSSKHSGGVNITFADGHVSFINDSIDYLVFCLLMTPEGKKCTPAGQLFQTAPAPAPLWKTYRTQPVLATDIL